MRKIVIVVGAPGSGKSTLTDIARHRGYRTVSVSEVLREKGIATHPQLLKDEVVLDAVLGAIPSDGDFILDECPNNLAQTEALFGDVFNLGKYRVTTVFLSVMDVAARLAGDVTARHRLALYERDASQMIEVLRRRSRILEVDANLNYKLISKEFLRTLREECGMLPSLATERFIEVSSQEEGTRAVRV